MYYINISNSYKKGGSFQKKKASCLNIGDLSCDRRQHKWPVSFRENNFLHVSQVQILFYVPFLQILQMWWDMGEKKVKR